MISLSRAAENDGDGMLDQAKRRNMTLAHQQRGHPGQAARGAKLLPQVQLLSLVVRRHFVGTVSHYWLRSTWRT